MFKSPQFSPFVRCSTSILAGLALLLPAQAHATWPEHVLGVAECDDIALVDIELKGVPDVWFSSDAVGLHYFPSLVLRERA